MAASTTASFAGLLVETFSRDRVFAPFERSLAKFHSMTQDFPNEAPLGKGRTFPIQTKDSHAAGAAAEATGVVPTMRQPEVLQANVDAVQIVAGCSWSELMLSAGQGLGSLGPDVITQHVEMTTRNATTALNHLSLGHGTGRLAVLEGTTNSATQIMRNPEGVLQLRANMLVDLYDTDVAGGAKQLGASFTISSVDPQTRTVVFTGAMNGTAGYGIYRALTSSVSTWGVGPFGLRAWGDDGTLTASIAGLTRATYPGVNANVIAASTGTIPYSEKLVRKGINLIRFRTDLEPDAAICNEGIISEHINHLVGDRIFALSGDSVPSYKIGYDPSKIGFQVGGSFVPYTVDRDFPARELTLFKKSMFKRHQLRPLNWLGDDSGVDGLAKAVLMQLPASGGSYALEKVAVLLAMVNYGNRCPGSICSIRTIADEELAGDTV